jgi:hypothetical protein
MFMVILSGAVSGIVEDQGFLSAECGCRLNAAYIGVHEGSLLGRHLWLKTFDQVQAAS